MFITMIALAGCSSFCFECDENDKNNERKEDDLTKAKAIEKIHLKNEEIIEFRKRTEPHYQGVVFNNRSILPESTIDREIDASEQWLAIQPYLNQHIYNDVQSLINPQADAQKYINLLLSLLTDGKVYQAVVLETNEQAPYYPGKYIFITRKEIESCQDEAILSELLSFRLVRNDYLNKHIEYSLLDKRDIKRSMTEIIQKDRSNWEEYSLDDDNNLSLEITKKVTIMMIRAGFKPNHSFTLEELPIVHSPGNPPHKSLEYITPLKRHKKVFD